MVDHKLFVFHGDLGAAKNILKNVVLLSNEMYFPYDTTNRLEFFKDKIYPPGTIDDWFSSEYAMKDYSKQGIEMILGDCSVDDLVVLPINLKKILTKNSYAVDLFNKEEAWRVVDLPHVKFLMVYPFSDLGVKWQVRAYATKKKPEQMHNFTYMDPSDVNLHIKTFGLESWIKVNLFNFYQHVLAYQSELKTLSWPKVHLEQVINPAHWHQLITTLTDYFQVDINFNDATDLLQVWSNQHWPLDKTLEWEHNDIFDDSRSEKSDLMIRTHSCQM
jgi:hypothetical protein